VRRGKILRTRIADLCNGRGGGRVMEHMDIYDMSFEELVDYIGDGDPAEILG
jgi:hypothetical protein